MMKDLVTGTSLEESTKKFTNHSARKTLVKKLKKQHLERSSIIKVTGHRNVNSLDDYDEADEEEQQHLSNAISRRNYLLSEPALKENINSVPFRQYSSAASASNSTCSDIQVHSASQNQGGNPVSHHSSTSNLQYQEQATANRAGSIFNNCTVTYNFGKTSGDYLHSKKRRRYSFIESDSD